MLLAEVAGYVLSFEVKHGMGIEQGECSTLAEGAQGRSPH